MLLRRHSVPHKLSKHLDKHMRKLFPFIIFLYSCGQLYFIINLSNYKNWIVWIPLSFCILQLLSPRCCKNLFKFKNTQNENKTYENYDGKFLEIYEKWKFEETEHEESFDQQNQSNESQPLNFHSKSCSPKEQSVYTRKLNLNELILYGVSEEKDKIWDPLLENGIEYLKKNISAGVCT